MEQRFERSGTHQEVCVCVCVPQGGGGALIQRVPVCVPAETYETTMREKYIIDTGLVFIS